MEGSADLRRVKRQLHVWFRRARYSRKPFFRRFPPRTDVEIIASRIRLLPERSAAYFRIPKAANSTVIATLMEHEGKLAERPDKREIEEFKFSGPRVTDLSEKDVDVLMHSWFKFSVVRHPVTRLLSAWKDKGEKYSGSILKAIGAPSDARLTLDRFVYYLECGGLNENAHWARQIDLICIPVERLVFVARVETLKEDLPEIMRRMYGRFLGVREFRPHATGAGSLVQGLDRGILRRIWKLYEPDFELLGYDLSGGAQGRHVSGTGRRP